MRELINILQRAVTMSDGSVIQPADLLLDHVGVHDAAPAPAPTSPEPAAADKEDDASLDTYMEGIEKQMLEDALKKARYNIDPRRGIVGHQFPVVPLQAEEVRDRIILAESEVSAAGSFRSAPGFAVSLLAAALPGLYLLITSTTTLIHGGGTARFSHNQNTLYQRRLVGL